MKYCSNCGEELVLKQPFCAKCGTKTDNSQAVASSSTDQSSTGLGVLGFFFPFVGLIVYLVLVNQSPLKAKSAGKGALIGVGVWFFLIIVASI
jgi:uncharacterized membrane protein YagU involved in acid resistance